MAKVTIDGISIDVPEGTTILQAARMIGGPIVPPAMCYYTSLKTSGGYCRTCIVNVTKGSEKDPRPMPKPVPSCRQTIMDGMEVQGITSPALMEARKGVVEFLLINHPLDCPICDEAGQCKLQDYAFTNSRGESRFEEVKTHKDKRVAFGPNVLFDGERCISCSRCIRFGEEIAEQPILSFVHRGDHVTIEPFPGTQLDNPVSMNVIDICPVGALTSRDFRFKARAWDMSFTD